MKNQYVADIGDYGKYSLLRAFSDAGVKVGVNWYLTDYDGSTDGEIRGYLNKETFRQYDPFVFDRLKQINESTNRTVEAIQNSDILSNVDFYDEVLSFDGTPKERKLKRNKWLNNSFSVLCDSELLFLDPDNGLLVRDNPSLKISDKYVLPSEVKAYWDANHNVVYYCHRGRRSDKQWQEYMCVMRKTIQESRIIVLTYHKGTQRSYVFLVRNKQYNRYRTILDRVLNNWKGVFTDERIENDEAVASTHD